MRLLFGHFKSMVSTLEEGHCTTRLWFSAKTCVTLYSGWRHLINLLLCNNECWPVSDQYCYGQLIGSKLNAAMALSQEEGRDCIGGYWLFWHLRDFKSAWIWNARHSSQTKKLSTFPHPPTLEAAQQVDLLISIQAKAPAHFHTDAKFTAEKDPPSINHNMTIHSSKVTQH